MTQLLGEIMKLASVAIVALSLAVIASPARAQVGATAKPPAGQAATTSAALPPTVAFEPLPSGGRRMTVSVFAPRTDATLGRPADVREVVLKSETWYCERSSSETGAFALRVRRLLEDYLSGNVAQTATIFRQARDHANAADLDAFGAYALDGTGRYKASRTERYPDGQGAAEMRLNDCYSAQEMLAIKAEVARILGPSQ
jgi:hypothetical protein